jgi:hypothetical protein
MVQGARFAAMPYRPTKQDASVKSDLLDTSAGLRDDRKVIGALRRQSTRDCAEARAGNPGAGLPHGLYPMPQRGRNQLNRHQAAPHEGCVRSYRVRVAVHPHIPAICGVSVVHNMAIQ